MLVLARFARPMAERTPIAEERSGNMATKRRGRGGNVKLSLEIKEVANGYMFIVDKNDDSQIWVFEGTTTTFDKSALGAMIIEIMEANK